MFRRAAMELDLDRAMAGLCPLISLIADLTILWEMVSVNITSRSGLPRRFFRVPVILEMTLAEHWNSLHRSLYWRTIHSFPPRMTTLMKNLLSWLDEANCCVKGKRPAGRWMVIFFSKTGYLCMLASANWLRVYHTSQGLSRIYFHFFCGEIWREKPALLSCPQGANVVK